MNLPFGDPCPGCGAKSTAADERARECMCHACWNCGKPTTSICAYCNKSLGCSEHNLSIDQHVEMQCETTPAQRERFHARIAELDADRRRSVAASVVAGLAKYSRFYRVLHTTQKMLAGVADSVAVGGGHSYRVLELALGMAEDVADVADRRAVEALADYAVAMYQLVRAFPAEIARCQSVRGLASKAFADHPAAAACARLAFLE